MNRKRIFASVLILGLAGFFIPNEVQAQCTIITTIAGTGAAGFSGDGGAATSALINSPTGIVVDRVGNIYFSDWHNNRIRKITPSGIISTFAGTGEAGYSGDGGPATAASFSNELWALAADTSGNILVGDRANNVIRKISTTGIVSTIAGTGSGGFSGDGGMATSATLDQPCGVALDNYGNIYITDQDNCRIRKVTASGVISTIAGNGSVGYSGDGGPATAAALRHPTNVCINNIGEVFVSDQANNCIRKISTSGIITTVAGTGTAGYYGDGGPATAAELTSPSCVLLDSAGNLFIADASNFVIRKMDTSGTISSIAGNGYSSYYGDGGPATAAGFTEWGIVFDLAGNIIIADVNNNRIRKISTTYPAVEPIVGPSAVARGLTITLTDSTAGGVWASSDTEIATVSTSGVIHGVTVGTVIISYTVTNSCGTTTMTKTITVINPVSVGDIKESDNNEINVIPNPNTGTFTLMLPEQSKHTDAIISDVTGRVMIVKSSSEPTIYFNMSQFAAGAYLLRTNVDGKVHHQKIIIQ